MQQDPHYKFDFFRRTKELKLYQILMPALVLTFCLSGALGSLMLIQKEAPQSIEVNQKLLAKQNLINSLLTTQLDNTSPEKIKKQYHAVIEKSIDNFIIGNIPQSNIKFNLSKNMNSVTLTDLTQKELQETKSLFAYKDTDYIIYQVYRYQTVVHGDKTDLTISLKYTQ